MANFVRHLPPKWELVRGESCTDKMRRKVLCEKHEEVESSRTKSSGLWWTDQRYVDQVVPAHFVHPDYFDTFNYRYQVYARPLVKVPPRSLAEACDHHVPSSYNVKRMAVDKMWVPDNTVCAHHGSRQPWQLTCCPPIRRENAEDCSQNNNTPVTERPFSADIFVSVYPLQHQMLTCDKNEGQFGLSDVDLVSSQTLLQDQEFAHASRPHTFGDPVGSAKQENNYNNDVFYGSNCHLINSQYKESNCDQLNTVYCNTEIDQLNTVYCNTEIDNLSRQDTSAYGLADCRTGNVPSQSTLVNTNCNQDCVVSSLLYDRDNNGQVDFIKELNRVVAVDNLIGVDITDIGNGCGLPNAAFAMGQGGHLKPAMYLQDGVITTWLRSDNLWCNNSLCRNNNAECVSVSEGRPGCVPRQCYDYCCYTPSPCQLNMSQESVREPNITVTSCTELLGHLQSRVKPKCFRDSTPKPSDKRVSEVAIETAYEKKMSDVGYRTYKIIGSKQYRLPPPRDYTADVKLPPHLEEYREFTRRCPNPQIGRYDMSDPANEMLLPGNIAANLIKVNRNPFKYARNPKCNHFPPLFYTPTETGELHWGLPSAILNPQ